MTQPLPTLLAYYGKLPARGDFLGRRLARETIGFWDDWLQQAIGRSRELIGASWLDLYLVSPLWRFMLPAGLCGGTSLAGVMMPSIDKVGRAFPLMLAAELPADVDPAALLGGGRAWFEAVEDLALATLAEDFVLDRLDAPIAVDRLAPVSGGTAVAVPDLGPIGHCAPLAGPEDFPLLASAGGGRSFWWTAGSERVSPALVIARGLPAPDGVAAFIDGDWTSWGWTVGAKPTATGPATVTEAVGPSGALGPMEADLLPWDREE
jgi:type VI secretion system protein ImpM